MPGGDSRDIVCGGSEAARCDNDIASFESRFKSGGKPLGIIADCGVTQNRDADSGKLNRKIS